MGRIEFTNTKRPEGTSAAIIIFLPIDRVYRTQRMESLEDVTGTRAPRSVFHIVKIRSPLPYKLL